MWWQQLGARRHRLNVAETLGCRVAGVTVALQCLFAPGHKRHCLQLLQQLCGPCWLCSSCISTTRTTNGNECMLCRYRSNPQPKIQSLPLGQRTLHVPRVQGRALRPCSLANCGVHWLVDRDAAHHPFRCRLVSQRQLFSNSTSFLVDQPFGNTKEPLSRSSARNRFYTTAIQPWRLSPCRRRSTTRSGRQTTALAWTFSSASSSRYVASPVRY